MSMIGRLISASRENRDMNPQQLFDRWISTISTNTAAGKTVTATSAEQLTAVYACIDLISGVHAQLPVDITEDNRGGRAPIANPPRWLKAPNPETNTWQGLIEQIDTSILTEGNAFIQVNYDRAGRVQELWPLNPRQMNVGRAFEMGYGDRPPLEPVYDYTTEDGRLLRGLRAHHPMERTEQRNGAIIHLANRRRPGALLGLSPIKEAREAIALGMTAEEYGARFFSNGAMSGVVLESEGPRPEEAVLKRMLDDWEERHKGTENAHRPAALFGGFTAKPISISPQDAQFLELRRFQVAEIARLFRVPPHMIGDIQGSTSYGQGVEMQDISFHRVTMQPHIVRWELAVEYHLLHGGRQLRTDIDALIRGDFKTRAEGNKLAIESGWKTINEVRQAEGLPAVEGGDDLYLPFNNLAPINRMDQLMEAQIQAKNQGPQEDNDAGSRAPVVQD